jgi:hypothetical protein
MYGKFFHRTQSETGLARVAPKQWTTVIIYWVLLALLVSACQSGPAATPAAIPTNPPPPAVQPTVVISTNPPPTALPPTATVLPSAVPPHPKTDPNAARIELTDTTMRVSPGNIDPNTTMQFVFGAAAGQTVTVKVTTEPANSVILSIWGADGTVLASEATKSSSWQGVVPSKQDYYIAMRSVATQTVGYTFTLIIPPLTAPEATRIQFKANTSGWDTSGNLAAKAKARFVLHALSGQQMIVNLTTKPAEGAFLYIWSVDGTVYTLMAPTQTWTGILSATQDYYVEVRSVSSQATTYQLSVKIPATASVPTQTDAPKFRVDKPIRFATGLLDVTVDGAVIRGERDRYSLSVLAGETLSVVISSTESNAAFSILGPDQKPLPGTEEGKDATQWSGLISAEGEYAILVAPTRGNATYKLVVKVSGK